MSADDNNRLTRRALEEIYANGDLELIDELIHPDSFAVRHVNIWRIADGKIADHWAAGMTSAC
jgi:predicted SnoaL-like aldol condensation-catalyzing enzyme